MIFVPLLYPLNILDLLKLKHIEYFVTQTLTSIRARAVAGGWEVNGVQAPVRAKL